MQFNVLKPDQSRGLSATEVSARQEKHGLNLLTPAKKVHPFIKYLQFLFAIFNFILLICGIVAYVIFAIDPANNFPNVYIGGLLIFVALVNAYIEFYQHQKSQAILDSFMNMIPSQTIAIREGTTKKISAVQLTIGDVVYLKAGNKAPADIVLFSCNELKVDNSSLTGEAEPQMRSLKNSQTNPLEASNLVFNGSLIVNGDGYGLVIRIGDNTVIGQIAYLTSSEEKRISPMSQEINFFVQLIGALAGVVTLIFFLLAILSKKLSLAISFNFAIGTFTAFVPQGLPALVTILLSLAAERMSKRNVLVKDLEGVETLGAITLLATDKTGTLTKNQMTVSTVWCGVGCSCSILMFLVWKMGDNCWIKVWKEFGKFYKCQFYAHVQDLNQPKDRFQLVQYLEMQPNPVCCEMRPSIWNYTICMTCIQSALKFHSIRKTNGP